MSTIRLHGDERELTLMARLRNGDALSPKKIIEPVLRRIRSLGPTVPLIDREGVFLTHGRAYRESGGLLELASADTQSPLEAVRQGALLRHVVADALAAVERTQDLRDFVVSQHNTAYSTHNPVQATAGHFNITRYRNFDNYLPGLVALGTALPCISGGGGFDMESLQFTLSIRGLRCVALLSNKTQSERGIIDSKPMPASRGQRQQLLIVDNLQSHVQTRCVYTVLNLFFTCAEHPETTTPDFRLKEPLADMHRMIRSGQVNHPFSCVDGRKISSLDIIRRLLDWYAAQLGTDWMPTWAEQEIAEAYAFVARLSRQGLSGAVGMADHATLHHLWQITLDEFGLTPERVTLARQSLLQMTRAYQGSSIFQDEAAPLVRSADALAGEVGRPSTVCADYLAAARSFMQLAYRYGDIRHDGVHAQLVEAGMTTAGVLFDRTHCRANANTAVPVNEGRASARGTAILRLHADGVSAASKANWDQLYSPNLGVLNLDEYETTDSNTWKPATPKPDQITLQTAGFEALHEYMTVQRTTTEALQNTDEEEGAESRSRHDHDDIPF